MKEAEKGKFSGKVISSVVYQLIPKTLFPFLYDYESDKNTSLNPSWDIVVQFLELSNRD